MCYSITPSSNSTVEQRSTQYGAGYTYTLLDSRGRCSSLSLLSFLFCSSFVFSFVLSGGESPSHWEYNHRALVLYLLSCGSLLCLSLLSFDTRHCRCVFCSLHAASLWAIVTGPLSCNLVVAAALSGLSAALPLCPDCHWRSPCRRTLLEVQCPCLNWGLLLVESHDHKKMIKNGFHLRSRCVLSLLSSESHIFGVEIAGLLLRTLLSS